MNDQVPDLTDAGRARRDQILAFTLRQVRRRKITRRLAGAAALFVLIGAMASLVTPPSTPTTATHEAIRTSPGIIRIATVTGAIPRIVTQTRSAADTSPPSASATWEVLDDQALLLALSSAGRPATLSRQDGRVRVVFADGQE